MIASRHRCVLAALVGMSAFAAATWAVAQSSPFEAGMTAAMTRMHHDMMAPPTGDPDRDFARMMIPHHQGAIDMARVQLQYGKDPRLRRLAQAIIVEQTQEIAVMRQVLDNPSVAPTTHPEGSHP